MKRLLWIGAVVSICLFAVPTAYAQQYTQLPQGTQIHLSLENGLSTSVARDGDPFTAVVSEPVYYGNQLVLPAGARVHGQVSAVTHPRHFAMIRGQAAMNLIFKSIEVDSRIIPAQMSILSIYSGAPESRKTRKDVHTVEGVVVEQKRDIKGAITNVGLGTAGGSVVGLVFSHVLRGTVLGLVGGGVYVVQKKGKDVELPAETGILVRMDSTVSIPVIATRSGAYNSGSK